jgi:hypothetical protein
LNDNQLFNILIERKRCIILTNDVTSPARQGAARGGLCGKYTVFISAL